MVLTVILLAGTGGVMRLAAQLTTAMILGTVTDATGAVIAGASIEVKNVGTGLAQATQSDAAGAAVHVYCRGTSQRIGCEFRSHGFTDVRPFPQTGFEAG